MLILSTYAGRKSVSGSQFGLRIIWISLARVYPVSSPSALFSTMYGPLKTTWSPYVDGFSASNSFAYSSGTGAEIGSDRACSTT